MPGVLQLFAVVAMSFACVFHFIMSSCALHHHVLNLHSSGFSEFSPLSVLSPDTLPRARGTSEILFYKWQENALRIGWKLACVVVLLLVGRPPSFIAFGVRLIAQPLNYSGIIAGHASDVSVSGNSRRVSLSLFSQPEDFCTVHYLPPGPT